MKNFFYLGALCLTCMSNSCLADGFTVTVVDAFTHQAIESATVVIVKPVTAGRDATPSTTTMDHAQTDEQGKVSFSNIDLPVDIRVLAAGYDKQILHAVQYRDDFRLALQPHTVYSEGVEVVASRIEETTSRIDLPAEILRRAAGSGDDPLKAITSLPGIVETEETSSRVYMRGSGSDENIVWINRTPVGYLYHFGGFQSTVHPKLVEDINLFLGGFPVEYGDALGGAIDVRLRTPRNDRLHTYLDISTISTSFLLEGPASGQDSFFVAGRRSYLDALMSPQDFNDAFEDEDDPDPDQVTLVPRFYDLQSLYHHELENGSLDTYLFAAGDKESLDIRGSAAADPQLAGRLYSEIEYQTLGTTWRQLWNERWSHVMVFSLYHEKERFELGRDNDGNPFYVYADAKTLLWQPEIRYQVNARSSWDMGIASSYIEAPVNLYITAPPDEDDPNFDFTSQPKYRLEKTLYVHSTDPYVKYRRHWSDRITTSLGMAYTAVEVTGGFRARELSPRAGLEYKLSDSTLLSAFWGRYLQVPSGVEIIENFGNPGLKMLEAEHRILGVEHRFNSLYSIKAEVYHKPMKNLVVNVENNLPPENYANAGTGEAYGIDLYLKRKAVNNTFGWLSASWSRTERTNTLTDERHDFVGDIPWSVTAVWGQPFKSKNWEKWEWSIKAKVNAGRLYTPIIGRHREDPNDASSRWIAEYAETNSARAPTYYKVDLRIGRNSQSNNAKFKFYVDIQNVTFNENIVDYDYGNQYEYIDNPKKVTGLEFFPYFGVEMEF